MAKQQILLVITAWTLHIAFFTVATTSVTTNLTEAAATRTIYDILEKNNLPRGLVPKGVRSYVVNPDGKIEVTLPGECNFLIPLGGEKYKFQFAGTFGGIIHSGSITEVYGVNVQIKFAWLGVNQVVRAGNQLTFHVQSFTQSFPISDFAVNPSCS